MDINIEGLKKEKKEDKLLERTKMLRPLII